MIINGSQDVQTPIHTARDLYTTLKAANTPVNNAKLSFIEVSDAGHMNSMSKAETIKAYQEFTKAH